MDPYEFHQFIESRPPSPTTTTDTDPPRSYGWNIAPSESTSEPTAAQFLQHQFGLSAARSLIKMNLGGQIAAYLRLTSLQAKQHRSRRDHRQRRNETDGTRTEMDSPQSRNNDQTPPQGPATEVSVLNLWTDCTQTSNLTYYGVPVSCLLAT